MMVRALLFAALLGAAAAMAPLAPMFVTHHSFSALCLLFLDARRAVFVEEMKGASFLVLSSLAVFEE